jgi:hypothetical protein
MGTSIKAGSNRFRLRKTNIFTRWRGMSSGTRYAGTWFIALRRGGGRVYTGGWKGRPMKNPGLRHGRCRGDRVGSSTSMPRKPRRSWLPYAGALNAVVPLGVSRGASARFDSSVWSRQCAPAVVHEKSQMRNKKVPDTFPRPFPRPPFLARLSCGRCSSTSRHSACDAIAKLCWA